MARTLLLIWLRAHQWKCPLIDGWPLTLNQIRDRLASDLGDRYVLSASDRQQYGVGMLIQVYSHPGSFGFSSGSSHTRSLVQRKTVRNCIRPFVTL